MFSVSTVYPFLLGGLLAGNRLLWIHDVLLHYRTELGVVASIITILIALKYLKRIVGIGRVLRDGIRDLASKFRRGRYVQSFWEDFVEEGFIVVLPPRDVDDEISGTMSFDYLGKDEMMDELTGVFGPLDSYRERITSDDFDQNDHDLNVLAVAGPKPNHVTRELLYGQPEIVYRFERNESNDVDTPDDIRHKIVGERDGEQLEFETEYTDEGNITRDFGIITWAKSPYNDDKVIVNVAGGFGQGTYAGFQLLRDRDALRYLLKHGGEYFQVVYTVNIGEEGSILGPKLIDQSADDDLRQPTVIKLYHDAE
ncbi:hypothetical protein BRC81_14970 [Halobacteriales archaeon QS_1_68_20]|nr:MAG: hypothetical protein BRC81_14970 [Halobacteriales archaeon QS_1_68_20]